MSTGNQGEMTMSRYLFTILGLLVLALPGYPQAQETTGEVAETAESAEPADETVEEEDEEETDLEDSDLDKQTYERDDDVFIPTEEIPADEPIPFPSNI